MIIELHQGHSRQQMIVLGIPGANVVETALDARIAKLMPAQPAAQPKPTAGTNHIFIRPQRVAAHHQPVEFRTIAGIGVKIDLHLLRGFVSGRSRLNFGVIEAVPLQQIDDPADGRVGFLGNVRSAEREFASYQKLPFVGWLRHALHREIANEERGLGDEF